VTYVLDASIAACWCFRDEEHPFADAALDRLERGNAVAPLHWWFEIRNVLLLSERRKRTTEHETTRFVGWLERLPIEFAAQPNQLAVLLLARQYRLTFYDAAYLELAKREELPLATLDGALANAARTEKVELVAD